MNTALSPLPPLKRLPQPAGALPPLGNSPAGLLSLSRRHKAAIIVRLLAAEGVPLSLTDLPAEMQLTLLRQMGAIKAIERETLHAVIAEFIQELEGIGLSFPGGLAGALSMMDGKVNADILHKLRKEAGAGSGGNAWERITAMEADVLLPPLELESIEVAAVMLSKLTVAKAAELLGRLPGERARRIAYAMSLTSAVTPLAVQHIGDVLVEQLSNQPVSAFDEGPVERIGAILNFSPANTRDDVLAGLEKDDAGFAAEVKKAIFTFAHIPERINSSDVPGIVRAQDQTKLVLALAYAGANGLSEQADFVLENISKRLAEQLREEIQEIGDVKEKDGEAAMSAVVTQIRVMEAAGDILFIAGDE